MKQADTSCLGCNLRAVHSIGMANNTMAFSDWHNCALMNTQYTTYTIINILIKE